MVPKAAFSTKTWIFWSADIAGYSIKLGLVGAAAWFLHACGLDLASIISILKK
jgi:hypothetical protein